MNDGRVVSNFIVQALKNEPITVFGDGSQTRSFCYVKDMVKGLVSLMESDPGITGPVNLGNPVETSIMDLVDIIKEITGSASKVVFGLLPEDDPRKRCPDIGLARNFLGWGPETCLRDGLMSTVEYFDRLLSQGRDRPEDPLF